MAQKQNFLQRMVKGIGATAKAAGMPFVSTITGRYNLLSTALLSRDYLREYKNWVFACVQARAEEVGNIQMKLLVNGEEVESHPVLDLLQKVNPAMTKHELFYATQAFKDLDGNAFWYLARDNGKGAIIEIYILRPDKVQIVPDKENPVSVAGYVYTQPDGQKIPFDAADILHFRNFNSLGYQPFPHRGMGIVEAASWAIDTDNEARSWNYNFFKNSARPDGILTTAGDSGYDPDELLRLREEWNTQHNGSDNASKVAILGGGMTWTEIQRSQKDMDFLNQRTFNRDEIISLFRTPKTLIGITDDVNLANAQASIYVFSLRTIKPLMQQMVDSLNEFLLPAFGDNLELIFESPVAEDRKSALDEYQAGISGGWLSINEVRAQEGLPEVDEGNSLYLPLNMVPVASVTNEQVNVEEDAEEDKSLNLNEKKVDAIVKAKRGKKALTPAEAALAKFIDGKKAKTRLPAAKKLFKTTSLSKLAREKYITEWKTGIRINTEPLQKQVIAYFEKQEKEVLKNVREQLKGFKASEFKYKSVDDMLFDEDSAIGASISLITPYIAEYIKTSGTNAAALVGLDSFDAETEKLVKFIQSRSKYFADTINGTTKEALLASIKNGLDDGETLNDIQTRVANVYQIAKGSRTQMIAKTEVSAASNQGAIGAYQQAGIEQIEWTVVNPEDEDCIENDGAIVDIGDSFPSGDDYPPVHPNCECTTLPVFS